MINVIIADDDYNVRTGLLEIIEWEKLGAKVVLAAEDGQQVIEFLNKLDVDLIISDIRMPLVDGIALTKYIEERSFDINIVLLSAYAEFEYAREALKLGVREYILKPINRAKIKMLSNIIRSIIIEKEFAKKISRLIHDVNFRKSIQNAMEDANVKEIESLLVINEEHIGLSKALVREYYLLFIDVLGEYIKDESPLSFTKDELLNSFLKITNPKDFGSFIKEKCQLILNSIAADKDKKDFQFIKRVEDYIKEKYHESDLNVQSVSNQFNLSSDYLSKLFKAQNGVNLSVYIAGARINKAAELLKCTNLSINRIAKKVGYYDANYFFRIFKRNTGVTPKEYRLQSESLDLGGNEKQ